jgi:hypothetical protein
MEMQCQEAWNFPTNLVGLCHSYVDTVSKENTEILAHNHLETVMMLTYSREYRVPCLGTDKPKRDRFWQFCEVKE